MILNVKVKKAPGRDLITGQILRELPSKAIHKLVEIFKAVLDLGYVPKQWKLAMIVMIPKPGKPLHEVSSYRPISLLPAISKLFERLYIKRLRKIVEEKSIIPPFQFGFRQKHATVEQIHRVTNIIEESLEKKKYCVAVFLDVAQAFDKVWHKNLLKILA